MAIRYREMATAIGRAAEAGKVDQELAAREYARLQRRAYEVADSLGADSIKAEAAISALNARLYCDRNGFECGLHAPSDEADQSAARYALPLGFVIVVFACIGLVLLIYPIPEATGDVTS